MGDLLPIGRCAGWWRCKASKCSTLTDSPEESVRAGMEGLLAGRREGQRTGTLGSRPEHAGAGGLKSEWGAFSTCQSFPTAEGRRQGDGNESVGTQSPTMIPWNSYSQLLPVWEVREGLVEPLGPRSCALTHTGREFVSLTLFKSGSYCCLEKRA